MNKRKILALAMTLCVVAILAIGGTLAYFTDTDAAQNVFTVGNVAIDLYEDFNTAGVNLIPAVVTGTGINNQVEKEIYVMNTGSEEAFVRVHIAVPAMKGASGEKAFKWITENEAGCLWDWSDGSEPEANTYNTTINDITYNVYVVTYKGMLLPDKNTCSAIEAVYMDSTITNEDVAKWNANYTDGYGSPVWSRIYVVAQGTQADGFNNAFEALNTSFPKLELKATDFLAASEGRGNINLD